jgi:hypothetical protein
MFRVQSSRVVKSYRYFLPPSHRGYFISETIQLYEIIHQFIEASKLVSNLEQWNNGILGNQSGKNPFLIDKIRSNPVFQYSNIPTFQL